MIVECTSCRTKYNVDDKKIPPAGVKVRCQKCQNVIIIKKEEPAVVPSTVAPPVVPPVVKPPVEPPVVKPPTVTPPPVEPPVVKPPEPPPVAPPQEKIETESYVTVPRTVEPPVKPPEPPPVAPPKEKIETESYVTVPKAAEPPPAAVEKPTVGTTAQLSDEDKRWHERARRLAKALASDLVLYNQDKVEQGLRDGTLVDLLGSEIRRSWEYYCQQIPKHIVQSTDFFKEQLNKIVCKGREIFK